MVVRHVDFTWHPGLSATQKKKSVRALHQAACDQLHTRNLLEISTKSECDLGVKLSAFNLQFTTRKNNLTLSVESAFQGSKVFSEGGPYIDLYKADSKSAKIDKRIRNSGRLISFRLFGLEWPLKPITAFYDWVYINALIKNPELADDLDAFDGFTDIEFNPEKSLNCQAHSAALYLSLRRAGTLDYAMSSPTHFLETVGKIRGYGMIFPQTLSSSLL